MKTLSTILNRNPADRPTERQQDKYDMIQYNNVRSKADEMASLLSIEYWAQHKKEKIRKN